MRQGDLFGQPWGNGEEGRRRKEEGFERVARAGYKAKCYCWIRQLAGEEVLPEVWRFWITQQVGPPPHRTKLGRRNFWGKLTSDFRKDGLIQDTGKRATMRSPKSKARGENVVYRIISDSPKGVKVPPLDF